MATPFSIHSEKYDLTGGAGGDAVRRATGRSKLDRLSVLIREAVQNSWDARRVQPGIAPEVHFHADLAEFSSQQVKVLGETIFPRKPADHPLRDALRPGLRRLILEDRGTCGLCGPVFKTKRTDPEEKRNFVMFLRDVGRASQTQLGGGTYGFGKSVFYNCSRAATIVVYSRFEETPGNYEERLIAASMWRPSLDEVQTGRHWWGVRHGGKPVGPLNGSKAGTLAGRLGFRPFSGDATGTAIMILDPQFPEPFDADMELAARAIGETMVIWYWPRILGGPDGDGRLVFSVSCKGQAVPVPDPASTAPFQGYVAAFRNLIRQRKGGGEPPAPDRIDTISSEKPQARLGALSLSLSTRQRRVEWTVTKGEGHLLRGQLADEPALPASSHHVALIREPGQVIRYMDCLPYPHPLMEYAGVFLVDGDPADVNKAFAASEPPLHDDFMPDDLENAHHQRYVRIGLRRIHDRAGDFAQAGRPAPEPGTDEPLGMLSSSLGELLSARGTGAGGYSGKGGGGGKPGTGGPVRIVMTGPGRLEQAKESAVFRVPFRIEGRIPKGGTAIQARPKVVVAGGGSEKQAPLGTRVPEVVSWTDAGGKRRKGADVLRLNPSEEGDWEIVVAVPEEVMVRVSLSVGVGSVDGEEV